MSKTVAVFCGSRSGNRAEYTRSAAEVGKALAQKKYRVVYGGAKIGLMGELANACLDNNGHVIGVMPHFLGRVEIVHGGLSQLIMVDSMEERKRKMLALSDAFLILPGGWGTLDEMYEVLTLNQVGQHQKPLWLLNERKYFDPILSLHQHMVQEGFLAQQHLSMSKIASNANDLLQQLEQHFV
jgi:uncharacterized protein (TIGR00730 family)